MKILFSPEFQGHVFLGLNGEYTHLIDVMVCDTMRLIGMLELRLGVYVEDSPSHHRVVKYFKAMSEYMNSHTNNALAASFKLSNLGTAEQALAWRDNLILDKWKPGSSPSPSGRLEVLSGTETSFNSPGMADRLMSIIKKVKDSQQQFDDIEIELPCEVDLLHPSVAELLVELEKKGATLTLRKPCDASGSNLSSVATLLQSTSKEKVTLNKADKSLLIYSFPDEKTANEYLAFKGDELDADLWINGANKSMDNWLRMMGKPTMGSSMDVSSPQVLQLFVLGIDMMKEPLNIHSMISWLYSPMQPFGTFFGRVLANAIISNGGYRNDKCRKVVENYISGVYTYHDKDKEAQLSEQEIAKRNAKEMENRKVLVETFLPSLDKIGENAIETKRLKKFLNSLSEWARGRVHVLSEKPNNEGWCSQLNSLAQMCDTFVLLMDTSGSGEYIEVKQVESWISTLYKGESFMQYNAQRYSRELIDAPAKMAAHSKRTVWMNFAGGDIRHLDCGFLYPTEREKIKDSITLWDENKEIAYRQAMQLLPFFMTEKQMILVVTDYCNGELVPKHPVIVWLESKVKNLEDFIIKPNLLDENTEKVDRVSNNKNDGPFIKFDHADLLRWPNHMSPTIISVMVNYPFDYMMEHMLNIVNTGPGSISDLRKTQGLVAHAVIESLFAPRDDKPCTAAEIEQRIKMEFDEQVRRATDACGAILYLPENRLDGELLKEQLSKCLTYLLEIISQNNLAVTGCEQPVETNMGLFGNNDSDMIGFIDMTLEDENHHPVVFDFKWTSSKSYHRDLLLANRSIQLELYRKMLTDEKQDAVQRTAYFLMPEGHLYSKELFSGRHCTQIKPQNNDNIVEQIRNSFLYRKNQLNQGIVEMGERVDLSELDYYNDTASKKLFPLKAGETGTQDKNNFSNYTLFKGLKEDQQ